MGRNKSSHFSRQEEKTLAEPVLAADVFEGIDSDFAVQVNEFIKEYRSALRNLAA